MSVRIYECPTHWGGENVGDLLVLGGDLLVLGGDFPDCLAPGGGAFDKFHRANFQIPHYAPRWGGWGLTLTAALACVNCC